MNRIALIGRITKELEIKDYGKTKVLNFTIAVKRKFTNETDFIPCVAFNKTAELIQEYSDKGLMIGVGGRLEIKNEKKDNTYKTFVNVIVDDVTLIDFKEKNKSGKFGRLEGDLEEVNESEVDDLLNENAPKEIDETFDAFNQFMKGEGFK